MLPGMSPRELRRALKRMGIELRELEDVKRVEIILSTKKIVIDSPQVLQMFARGTNIFQITGGSLHEESLEEEVEIEISDEDVEFIVSQTGVSKEEAKKALIEAKGDIAEALLKLKSMG